MSGRRVGRTYGVGTVSVRVPGWPRVGDGTPVTGRGGDCFRRGTCGTVLTGAGGDSGIWEWTWGSVGRVWGQTRHRLVYG